MRVDVWSDYICPWCYLATGVAAWLAGEHGCDVVWHPFELHPELPPGGAPLNGGKGRMEHLMEEAGLPYRRPARVVNSHAALEIGELARRRRVFDEWHHRVFTAHFFLGLDISDEEVLRGVGEEAGLDPDDVSEALSERRYGDVVDASKATALEFGIGGTPAFLFDRRLVIPGVQNRGTFERALVKLLTRP